MAPEQDALMERLLEGDLADGEAETLARDLARDAGLARRFRARFRVHVLLHDLLREGRTSMPALSPAPRARPVRLRPRHSPWPWLLAAACLMAALTVWWQAAARNQTRQTIPPEGPLLMTWRDTVQVARGGQILSSRQTGVLQTGDQVLTSEVGQARIIWEREGSEVAVHPGSRLALAAIAGDRRMDLAAGRIACRVVRQEAGRAFTVTTPQAVVTVVGTRFDVQVDAGATQVGVDEGRVMVEERSTGRRTPVDAGGGLRLGPTVQDHKPAEPVLHLLFDDATRPGHDRSGGLWPVTAIGQPAVLTQAGIRDGVLVCDGRSALAVANVHLDTCTIACWIATRQKEEPNPGQPGEPWSWWHGRGLVDGDADGVRSDLGLAILRGQAVFGAGGPDRTVVGPTAVADGAWHHLAATRDGTSGRLALWIDGLRQAEAMGPTGPRSDTDHLAIGRLCTGSGFFVGRLADVRIYDRVMGPEEIRALGGTVPAVAPE